MNYFIDREATQYYKNGYKVLFYYDQICQFDIPYGVSVILYKRIEDKLHIAKVLARCDNAIEFQYPIKNKSLSDQALLEEFVTYIFSYPKSFAGRPEYVRSDHFTEAEFEALLEKGLAIDDERIAAARKQYKQHEAYLFAVKHQLNPQPIGYSISDWRFNCISGGSHQLDISLETNTWGCGYCRKKGDLQDLYDWYEAVKPPRKVKKKF